MEATLDVFEEKYKHCDGVVTLNTMGFVKTGSSVSMKRNFLAPRMQGLRVQHLLCQYINMDAPRHVVHETSGKPLVTETLVSFDMDKLRIFIYINNE